MHLTAEEMEEEIHKDSKITVREALASGTLPFDYGILTQPDPGWYIDFN